jgi:hypothetical protein
MTSEQFGPQTGKFGIKPPVSRADTSPAASRARPRQLGSGKSALGQGGGLIIPVTIHYGQLI